MNLKDSKHVVGNIDKLSPKLIGEFLKFCSYLKATYNVELVITSGYRPNDPSSQHRLGLALDVVPVGKIKLLDLYLAAERFNFTGIGVYPDWKYNNETVGGLHIDVRDIKEYGARWFGVRQSDGKNLYLGLTLDTLKKYGVI